jgi:hypothetical protein
MSPTPPIDLVGFEIGTGCGSATAWGCLVGEVGVQTDLVAFLLACIEEDERRIQATLARVRGWNRLNLPWLRAKRVDPEARQPEEMLLAEWDPERLLLECDTKRRIIELHWHQEFKHPAPDEQPIGCALCHSTDVDYGGGWCQTLRLLTLPYRDRPGYVEAWAPDGR